MVPNCISTRAFQEIERGLRGAAIGNVGELDPGHLLEQCAGKVRERGRARGGIVEHARPRAGERNQLLESLRGYPGK
jgi:hypothetical protein